MVENKLWVFCDQGSRAFGLCVGLMVVDDARAQLHPHIKNNRIWPGAEFLSVVDELINDFPHGQKFRLAPILLKFNKRCR
jgi:hypothetical protein